MVLETAVLKIKQGRSEAFEKDFEIASQYISGIKGYIKHDLRKCVEKCDQYLLLVEWETIEDHEIGFRESRAYLKWKSILHHYYDPFPEVLHYILL